MGKWFFRIIKAAGIVLFGTVGVLIQNSPDSLVSNVSKWLIFFHFSVPDFLKNKTADTIIFPICILFVIFFILALIKDFSLGSERQMTLNKKRKWKALDKLKGETYEKALEQLTVNEREQYLLDSSQIGFTAKLFGFASNHRLISAFTVSLILISVVFIIYWGYIHFSWGKSQTEVTATTAPLVKELPPIKTEPTKKKDATERQVPPQQTKELSHKQQTEIPLNQSKNRGLILNQQNNKGDINNNFTTNIDMARRISNQAEIVSILGKNRSSIYILGLSKDNETLALITDIYSVFKESGWDVTVNSMHVIPSSISGIDFSVKNESIATTVAVNVLRNNGLNLKEEVPPEYAARVAEVGKSMTLIIGPK